jgi:CDGSH iron-sulfur domain-containing protein 3
MEEKRQSTPHRAADSPYEVECKPGLHSWCACGFSEHQPFCDGTHREKSEMRSFKFTIDETKQVYLCGCKQTKNPPFCDGSHKDL